MMENFENSSERIKIDFDHSPALETERVSYAIKKIDWFKKNGYTLDFPKKLEELEADKLKALTEEEIKESVLEEYKEKEYLEKINKARIEWLNISEGLLNKLRELELEPEPSYKIILSKYGGGGSYNLPNEITINFKNRGEKFIQTVVHEIIHLLIEPWIQKYKTGHWEKERVVDLISLKMEQGLGCEQRLSENVDTKKIDEIFEKFFPNIEEIIKNISSG